MGCLGAASYDPASAVSNATDTLLAMTALDTTNLRVSFTAPDNGAVVCRLKCQIHGASFGARILLGVMEGATVRGRMSPTGMEFGADAATQHRTQEAVFLVTGLTPSGSYAFDAAYGVEVVTASTAIKYGGPDNATTDDAFGAFEFEVWEAPTLLAGTLYDPASAVTKTTNALQAMTAFDTTNLRHTITAPASGRVHWRIFTVHHGATTSGQRLFGILDGATVRARSSVFKTNPFTGSSTANAVSQEASGVISGLTPSGSYTFDAAYGVEIVSSGGGLKYGGPDNAITNDAFGGIAYELWEA